LVLAGIAVSAFVAGATALLSYATLRSAPVVNLPIVQDLVSQATERESRKHEAFVRDNINALAVKLGEMQAHLMRLDALGDRLVSLAGTKSPRDLRLGETPGRGGAAPTTTATRQFSLAELQRELDQLTVRLDNRSDTLRVIEDELLRERARKTLLPSAAPIDAPYPVSGFGWRIDPFSGRHAMHEGVDFAAPFGTPILAAAGGIVVTAELHPAYGNMVEIDHGQGLLTRYAHASKLMVKTGEVVKRGHKIAEVGSTGHSTGPHLHFEVREHGVAQNPTRFLTTLASK
jgi:murein DD-endopeptidase MepM/ murein hydrolase activator NlpD